MLFKQGFWRWVVALVDCLVPSRFWHDGGQVSAVLGVFPLHAHSKALPALGMCRHSMALPKATQPAFASLSRQGWRTRALPRGAQRGAILCRACVSWDWGSCLLQGLPPGGKAMEAHRSILLLAHGETSPRGKYQCAIPALLPLPFGHRSLMSGGKQIKSHQMPAGEWKGQKLARKWFCMSFCPA